ncbi:DNA-directed RNA polymerase specialized sigma24 family protein [Mucilaginibacter yixingensis]|uniref:DNA-directed RNA polymerase specialized sigma24 family protein n=2 Tax=Mucilaginibacter yixingensis TaxID=1295612 RepID=A0A2T5J6F4_9SPHI|nr:DNA-directed RNA polymerase specialized sigma24 family protein [Mucilaginibacter yixingensis]
MYATRTIYEQYSAMLLGYIYEVVKDQQLAEHYLAEVFTRLPLELKNQQPDTNIYLHLQLMARKLLLERTDAHQNDEVYLPATQNKFLAGMTTEQQTIFCRIYYQGQSTAQVAASLQMDEAHIRKILKEAFAAIRKTT